MVPGLIWVSWLRIRSMRLKMTRQNRKVKKFSIFEVLDVFLRADGFSCSLDFLHGSGSAFRIDLKCWIQIRIRIETNADPQQCSEKFLFSQKNFFIEVDIFYVI
jgi:hypothetical protein